MGLKQTPSNEAERKTQLIRRVISVVSGAVVFFVGTALFWTSIREVLKAVPDDLRWFWGALIAATIYVLVALFVYLVAQKTLWELSELLIVPLVLVGIGLWFTQQQDARQREQQTEQAMQAQQIEKQRAQDQALETYLDQMGVLLGRGLRTSEVGSEEQTLARAQTLTVLTRLDDPARKETVLQFLYEANLIGKDNRVVALDGADLHGVNLTYNNLSCGPFVLGPFAKNFTKIFARKTGLSALLAVLKDIGPAFEECAENEEADAVNLSGVNLSNATLREAELDGAILTLANLEEADIRGGSLIRAKLAVALMAESDLSGANFYDANLVGADLSGADLTKAALERATLAEADLTNADLSKAYLYRAEFSDADLTSAKGVTGKQLEQQAASLKGATMPDGQKYEDWLKSKGHTEDRENTGPS